MKTNARKLIASLFIVFTLVCFGCFAASAEGTDTASTTAQTTASEEVSPENEHNTSLSIGLVAAAWYRSGRHRRRHCRGRRRPRRHRRQQRKPQDLR